MTAAGMEQFATLFSGGKAVELEERQSRSMMRDDEEDGAPPRGPVDLDSGVVRISRPGSAPTF